MAAQMNKKIGVVSNPEAIRQNKMQAKPGQDQDIKFLERAFIWCRSLVKKPSMFFYRAESNKHRLNSEVQRSAERNYYFRNF